MEPGSLQLELTSSRKALCKSSQALAQKDRLLAAQDSKQSVAAWRPQSSAAKTWPRFTENHRNSVALRFVPQTQAYLGQNDQTISQPKPRNRETWTKHVPTVSLTYLQAFNGAQAPWRCRDHGETESSTSSTVLYGSATTLRVSGRHGLYLRGRSNQLSTPCAFSLKSSGRGKEELVKAKSNRVGASTVQNLS